MWRSKCLVAICLGKTNMETINKKILVTGSAGFIVYALMLRLLERGDTVIGIDNHNNYWCLVPQLIQAYLMQPNQSQCFFHRRIRQTKPFLKEVDAQHGLNRKRRSSALGASTAGRKRLNQAHQLGPWHHQVHLVKKQGLRLQ